LGRSWGHWAQTTGEQIRDPQVCLVLVGLDRLVRVAVGKLDSGSKRRCCRIAAVAVVGAGHSSLSGLVGCSRHRHRIVGLVGRAGNHLVEEDRTSLVGEVGQSLLEVGIAGSRLAVVGIVDLDHSPAGEDSLAVGHIPAADIVSRSPDRPGHRRSRKDRTLRMGWD